jgi:uncharacterized protein (UPF0128 family)
MSSSIDNIECPACGGNAQREQDHNTDDITIWCHDCDFESVNGEETLHIVGYGSFDDFDDWPYDDFEYEGED